MRLLNWNAIEQRLQIRPDERNAVKHLLVHHFFQGLGVAFLHITSIKLFFKYHHASGDQAILQSLAYVLIGAAAIQFIAGRIYAYLRTSSSG